MDDYLICVGNYFRIWIWIHEQADNLSSTFNIDPTGGKSSPASYCTIFTDKADPRSISGSFVNSDSKLVLFMNTNDAGFSADPRAELIRAEEEVSHVGDVLAKLLERVQLLKARINTTESLILHILPPEIIADIFLFCIPPLILQEGSTEPVEEGSTDQREEGSTDTSRFTPLELGSVCSSWRKIAWSTPSLWSSLALHFTNTHVAPLQILLLEQWLSRSGSLPLSMRFSSSREIHWKAGIEIPFFNVINAYSSRWGHFDFRLPCSCYPRLPGPDTVLSSLQLLCLKPDDPDGNRVRNINFNAPQLQHLSVSRLYVKSLKLTLAALTHLDLESFYPDEFLAILRQTPQIVDVWFKRILDGDDGHELPKAPLLLSSLKKLRISNDHDIHLSLLDNIIAPQLDEFHCYTTGPLATSTPTLAISSMEACSLKILVLKRLVLREEQLVELLQPITSLTTLSLTVRKKNSIPQPVTDHFLQLCNPTHAVLGQGNCLLPRLESLIYHGPQSFKWSTVLHLLESRTVIPGSPGVQVQGFGDAVSTIEFAAFNTTHDASSTNLDLDETARLLKLKDSGVQFTVKVREAR
ncbi:hypothetical protein B0H34DRAFT_499244 [Crassisporium funariophilum]|nr:hypothetical protein B0H34DRAFT_499244 [Crassisporium funariophilum]